MTRVAATLLALVLLAGCGGDEEPTPQVGLRVAAGAPAPGAGEVLERFVAAAGRGDAAAMWQLLSEPTRASYGGTLERFRRNAAGELEEGVGPFAGSSELVLARAFGGEWAVAAVAGEVEREGERDHDAHAAALRREEAGWRLELGGIHFVGHDPAPGAELGDPEPALGATAQASGRVERMVLWLDGEVVGARTVREQPFTGTISARVPAPLEPGVHVVAVFAVADGTAAAQAWPFEVED